MIVNHLRNMGIVPMTLQQDALPGCPLHEQLEGNIMKQLEATRYPS